jgi:hypothetical protein
MSFNTTSITLRLVWRGKGPLLRLCLCPLVRQSALQRHYSADEPTPRNSKWCTALFRSPSHKICRLAVLSLAWLWLSKSKHVALTYASIIVLCWLGYTSIKWIYSASFRYTFHIIQHCHVTWTLTGRFTHTMRHVSVPSPFRLRSVTMVCVHTVRRVQSPSTTARDRRPAIISIKYAAHCNGTYFPLFVNY